MEKYDVHFKKRFGQNFLKEINTVKKIVDIGEIQKDSLVIEVGPGGAIMTKELAKKAKQVIAYEIDKDLEDNLYSLTYEYDNIRIIFKDFLETNIEEDLKDYEYTNIYFISNIPYYITTPIIMKLIDSKIKFKKIVMMVQKEVGDRFSTNCGNKNYSSITVLLNYYYDIKKEFYVSRKQFVPEPNVDSVIVSFTEKDKKLDVKDFDLFEKIVRDSFQFKRKTIKNNLKKYNLEIIERVLKEHKFDLNTRSEMLPLDVFVDISNNLYINKN